MSNGLRDAIATAMQSLVNVRNESVYADVDADVVVDAVRRYLADHENERVKATGYRDNWGLWVNQISTDQLRAADRVVGLRDDEEPQR